MYIITYPTAVLIELLHTCTRQQAATFRHVECQYERFEVSRGLGLKIS
jgi:hypothetical protein